jgi:hypothetical protein
MEISKAGIPYIDPNVQFVGVSKLRQLNATALNDLNKTLVIQDNDKPLAVVISYEQFMEMQRERESALATLAMIMNEEENTAVQSGLEDFVQKKVRSVAAVREELKKK